MSTYNDIQLSNTWVDIYDLVGGKDLTLQNKGSHPITVAFTEQAPTSSDGTFLNSGAKISVPASVTNIWARADSQYGNSRLGVENADATYTSGIPADLLTSEKVNIRRLSVDAQPTSYEANEQFKIFHRMINIATTTQPAFRFTATDPVNIMERKINIWSGGREYLVIPDDGSHPTQEALFDALVDTVAITNVNGNLEDSGLTSHPVSGVEIKYLELTGGNIFTIADTDQYPNGDAVQTDGNTKRANNQLLSSPNMSGVAAGQGFFLVFRNIAQSAATNGHFYLQWEERFNN